jgi:hypothetical protein
MISDRKTGYLRWRATKVALSRATTASLAQSSSFEISAANVTSMVFAFTLAQYCLQTLFPVRRDDSVITRQKGVDQHRAHAACGSGHDNLILLHLMFLCVGRRYERYYAAPTECGTEQNRPLTRVPLAPHNVRARTNPAPWLQP